VCALVSSVWRAGMSPTSSGLIDYRQWQIWKWLLHNDCKVQADRKAISACMLVALSLEPARVVQFILMQSLERQTKMEMTQACSWVGFVIRIEQVQFKASLLSCRSGHRLNTITPAHSLITHSNVRCWHEELTATSPMHRANTQTHGTSQNRSQDSWSQQ